MTAPTAHRWRLIALVAGLVIAAAGPAAPAPQPKADSWPMLGGSPSRNPVNAAARNVPVKWSVEPGNTTNVKWTAKLGSACYGSPVVAGGRVFVGTNNSNPRNPKVEGDKGVLMCFEEATGKFLWQAVHDKLDNQNENDYPEQGIASTPCVDGDHVYYVSNRCELVCVTAKGKPDGTADVVWSLDMIKVLKVYPCLLAISSPLLVGDLVYVVTGNGIDSEKRQVVNPDAPSFLAARKDTGEVVWTSNLPGAGVMEGQWSSPVYAVAGGQGQVIFPGGDGWLYSFQPDTGKLLWKFDGNPRAAVDRPRKGELRNYFIATPVVREGKLYVGMSRSPDDGVGVGHLWCIDVAKSKGGADVSPREDHFDPKAAVNKDSALVWHYGGLNPNPASKRKFLFSRTLCSCAVEDGLAYVADYDGFLHCLDARTGEKKWDFDLKATVWGSLAVMDGKVYAGTENGEVWVFKAGKNAPAKELNKIDMLGTLKNAPAFANGVLYFVTDGELFAIQQEN